MCTALEPKVATGRCTLTGHKFVPMNNSVYKQHKLIIVNCAKEVRHCPNTSPEATRIHWVCAAAGGGPGRLGGSCFAGGTPTETGQEPTNASEVTKVTTHELAPYTQKKGGWVEKNIP